jgi:protein-S-isoprenylcysteine O-methyltransferase Ste14
MTVAHLLFAMLCTAYIAVGTRLEERDLETALPEYAGYKQAVPMFVPGSKPKSPVAVASA